MNLLSQLIFALLSLRPTPSLCPENDPTTHGPFLKVPNCPLHWRHNPPRPVPTRGPSSWSLSLRVGTRPTHPCPARIREASATRPGASADSFPTQSWPSRSPWAHVHFWPFSCPWGARTCLERHEHRRPGERRLRLGGPTAQQGRLCSLHRLFWRDSDTRDRHAPQCRLHRDATSARGVG